MIQSDGKSTPFLSFINSATAYANISDLLGPDFAPTFHQNIVSQLDQSATSLVPSQDSNVVAGYKAIYSATANMLSTPVGQVEILLSLTGTSDGGAQSIAIQAALQHPFSQGRLYIKSSDPFEYPVIDPNYLSHSAGKYLFVVLFSTNADPSTPRYCHAPGGPEARQETR